MNTHVTGVGAYEATDRELDVMNALRRLRPALDPEPGAREAAKNRLMMVLTAMKPEVVQTTGARLHLAG
ncbi:hypothetical protein [Pseudonocardia abyssalis]|uniref:Uncharacterized protein n=1 Tax=Pseudonocardia abyssalis TaxID=2792008 RepID=A0ABS6UZK0_9PSEU|nr:hypothetical protein [Pseudonocardia abyssalis]MBW0119277.1 hypothetical protein [Pseudonocardia abyssalis]MBW0137694.1 hypothetical protein [Pseudonocardia abyssalis]